MLLDFCTRPHGPWLQIQLPATDGASSVMLLAPCTLQPLTDKPMHSPATLYHGQILQKSKLLELHQAHHSLSGDKAHPTTPVTFCPRKEPGTPHRDEALPTPAGSSSLQTGPLSTEPGISRGITTNNVLKSKEVLPQSPIVHKQFMYGNMRRCWDAGSLSTLLDSHWEVLKGQPASHLKGLGHEQG